MEATLFEKIINKEIPADILYEDELSIVIKDISPQAPTHLLIIPKKVIPKLSDATDEDQNILGHLMLVAGKEIENYIQKLSQMARAAGIHIIMATQRPSVDVITGTIKANFPTRISFQVTSKIDSRTILGEQGGEKLLGKGDLLITMVGKRLLRVHGPFVKTHEKNEV